MVIGFKVLHYKKGSDSVMTRKQINVRLSDEENTLLDELAKAHNKSKSEIVRQAFKGELAKIDSQKNKTLSDEERKDILVTLGSMMTYLSDVRNHVSRLGGNANQIAKILNKGGAVKLNEGVKKFHDDAVEYSENVKENLEIVAEELDKIWHTLV